MIELKSKGVHSCRGGSEIHHVVIRGRRTGRNRKKLKQVFACGACGPTLRGNCGTSRRYVCLIRNTKILGRKRNVTLPFVIDEEESLILDNWSTKSATELHVAQWGGLARTGRGATVDFRKVIRGIGKTCVANPAGVAVEPIGSALHNHIYRSTALHSEFSRRVFLYA